MARRKQPIRGPLVPVQLTAEQAQAFDRLQRHAERSRRFRRSARLAKRARQLLDQAFGPSLVGTDPDGRLIVRSQQTRLYDPLPGKTVEWNEYRELPAWDADGLP